MSELDPEQMYTLIQAKRWNKFLDVLYKQKSNIRTNAVAQQAIAVFTREFISAVKSETPTEHLEALEKIWLLHVGRLYTFQKEELDEIVILILQAYRNSSLKKAYDLAKTGRT